MLNCDSLQETLLFWENLGFIRTYFQKSPYQYGVARRGSCEIHFQSIRDATVGVTCLVIVSNVEEVHAEFVRRMKHLYGKISSTGFPRISRMKPGQTRFTVTDVSRNSVIFIKDGNEDNELYAQADRKGMSQLQKAIALAIRLRDLKLDYPAALKVIENGLRKSHGERAFDIARALHINSDLASLLNDIALQQRIHLQILEVSLTVEEQQRIKREFSLE